MKKRLLGIILALCLTVGLCAPVMAASETEMLGVLAAMGVLNGDEKGNLNLTGGVTRAQFAKMVVSASIYGDKGGESSGVSPFSDVKYSHWAAGFVATARDAGWINGYLDGTFRPDKAVTLAEAVTVLEKLLGYSDTDFRGTWPSGQMSLARSLSLTSGVTARDLSALTRLQCAQLVYNTLNAKTKAGAVYAQSLGYALDTSGKIDYLSLMNDAMDGPIVVTDSSWQTAIGFTPIKVYRNSAIAAIGDIGSYDLLYYSEKMKTVWAFFNPKTGTIDSVLPNTANPTSIIVSGVTYELGTSEASFAVSNLGSFKVGDGVTVLLGRDDKAAAILRAQDVNTTVVGLVTGKGVDTYVNAVGDRYTKDYISLLATDGTLRKISLANEAGASKGDVVSVSVSGSNTTVKKLSSGGVSGKVNTAGTQIGTVKLSSSAEILDVFASAGKKIASSRLAGVTIDSGDVLAIVKNSAGEIEKLVLKDVTGDVHNYGILTEKTRAPGSGLGFTVYYKYISGGVSTTYPSVNRDFGGSVGPVRIEGGTAAPTGMKNLKSGSISEISISSATMGANRFDLTASVQVYEKRSGDYYLTSLSAVNTTKYTLTGWYDALQSEGGRLRVITAVAK